LAVVGVLSAFACSSSTRTEGGSTCTPGATQKCVALSGCEGAQRCEDDRTWGECVCFVYGGASGVGGVSGAGGNGGSFDGGAGPGGGPSGASGAGPAGAGPGGAGPGGVSGNGGAGGVPPGGNGGDGPAGSGGALFGGIGGIGGGVGAGPAGASGSSSTGGAAGTGGVQNCPQAQCLNVVASYGLACSNKLECSCAGCSCDVINCGADPGCAAIVRCSLENGCGALDINCFYTPGGKCYDVTSQFSGSVQPALNLYNCASGHGCPTTC
jgi:hypothetical protein